MDLDGILETKTTTAFRTYRFTELDEGAPAAVSSAPPAEAPEVVEAGRTAIRPVLSKLTENFDLDRNEIFSVIHAINDGALTDVQIAGFLIGLMNKGPSIGEVAHIAEAMREVAIPVPVTTNAELTDTCGTGGGLTTFNVSTANSIMAAAAGIKVAKHGSRSISSPSGSADVLEALGVSLEPTAEQAGKLIDDIGIAFLYAPNFHPVMGKVFGPENQLGIKTIFFTIIGPLINPAKARNHTLGVYQPELVPMIAKVAAEMDFNHVLVSHGMDGLDELSLLGKTSIADVRGGEVRYDEVVPEDFGFKRCSIEDIAGGSPEYNAKVITELFAGRERGPKRDFLVLNNAATLYVSGRAASIADGIAQAEDLLDSGAATAKLAELVSATRAL
ncbi:MAG: anthranilate phosphoribosyltransferase [Propionibacterium sp.]|nr:anthranilate phosphoribosyltransferase [Propionibacterium sp.]